MREIMPYTTVLLSNFFTFQVLHFMGDLAISQLSINLKLSKNQLSIM